MNSGHAIKNLLLAVTATVPMFCSSPAALAADTPFGFQIGVPVAGQLPECSNSDAMALCVEPQEQNDWAKTYVLRHERNILGGAPQVVYLVETAQGIEQVQVVFPSEQLPRVKGILQGAFGEPALEGHLSLWDGQSYLPAVLQHWVLEDGVITLQDKTVNSDRAVAVIRSNQNFDDSLSIATQSVPQLLSI